MNYFSKNWEQIEEVLSQQFFNITLEVLVNAVRQEEMECIQLGKKVWTVFICRWQDCLCRKAKESTTTTKVLELSSELAKSIDTRKIYKSQVLFYMPAMNKKNWKFEKVPFAITSTNERGRNLTKIS